MRRGRRKTVCARGADQAASCGRSTSPLGRRGSMNSVPRWLCVLVLLAAAVAADAFPFGRDEQPTSHTKPRHQYHGFSVEPPTSAGGVVRISEQNTDQTVYRQIPRTKTHTRLPVVSRARL